MGLRKDCRSCRSAIHSSSVHSKPSSWYTNEAILGRTSVTAAYGSAFRKGGASRVVLISYLYNSHWPTSLTKVVHMPVESSLSMGLFRPSQLLKSPTTLTE